MQSVMAFLRVRLLEAQLAGTPATDPFCAVNMKECVTDEQGTHLVQKKETFYPLWRKCFDSHIYPGRCMQVLVADKAVVASLENIQRDARAEVTVELEELSRICKEEPDPSNAVMLAVRRARGLCSDICSCACGRFLSGFFFSFCLFSIGFRRYSASTMCVCARRQPLSCFVLYSEYHLPVVGLDGM